jgi:hypothetical protein
VSFTVTLGSNCIALDDDGIRIMVPAYLLRGWEGTQSCFSRADTQVSPYWSALQESQASVTDGHQSRLCAETRVRP